MSDIKLKGAYQDGANFYRDDGAFIANYQGTVAHDHDMLGARRARAIFAEEHPEFVEVQS